MFRATKCSNANIAAILHNNAIKTRPGTKSITCEKRVRPEYMTVPRLKSQNRVRNYRQNPKPCSSRHQKKHPRNPYIAALFYKITLAEPDSTDRDLGRRPHGPTLPGVARVGPYR